MADGCKVFLCIFCILLIITGIILGIYFGVKSSKKKDKEEEKQTFTLTEKHKTRVSLLQQCMNMYGVVDIPELKDEEFNSTEVSANKILSISKIEINGYKGETIKIFKNNDLMDIESGEYTCIGYNSSGVEHVIKISNGVFTIPNDLDNEANETEFTFILYFNYDPEINKQEYRRNLNNQNYNTSLVLYDSSNNNRNLVKRKLSIFSKIIDFFDQSIEEIVEKAVGKLVSTVCVALIKYLFEDYNNIIIKSVGQFACDELGEFAGKGIRKLVFNSDSKPAENYKELVYEEAKNYNFAPLPSDEAETLRNSIKGKNKNVTNLIKFIISRTNEERQNIKKSYNSFYGDLIEDLKDEFNGDFEEAVLALFYHPVDYDCFELRKAIYGLGTDEDTLIEIIANRPNNILKQIKQRYTEIYPGTYLIQDVIDDSSGKFKDTLVALLEEKRANNTEANLEDCEISARLLYQKADGNVFLQIFTEKSQADFVVIEDFYYSLADKTLLQTIEKEFSGDFKDALIGIYYSMLNPAEYYAKKIHDSLYGLGTNDNTLIRVLVTRYEEDMPLINEVYKKLYDADMIEDIIDDTSGSYKTLLVSLASGKLVNTSSYIKTYIKEIFIFILCFIILNK